MSDKHSKTEKPTPKKLREAKKKGQVVKSSELSPAISLLIFSLSAAFLGNYLINNSLKLMRNAFNMDFGAELTVSYGREILNARMMDFFVITLPYLAIALLLGFIVNVAQVGFNFSTQPIKPDIKKLNPIEGFKNIFSKKAIFTFAKNLLKLILVFFLTYRTLSTSSGTILNAGEIGTSKLFFFLLDFVKELVLNIGIVMLLLAAADYVFQRKEHHDKLKMTKQEIKDEYKEIEGNPEIKRARAQRQREISMNRMMASLHEADVIITNPTHLSIAIRYDAKKDNAPIVIAKGADHLAMKIREKAKEHKIPLIENKEVARAIYKKTEIGQYVPIELYQAVAEILALVYKIKAERKYKI